MYSDFIVSRFESMDRVFAWKITAKNIFKPLYGDYSVTGYVFGFLFRVVRLLTTTILYTCIFVIALLLYIIWFLIPPFLLYKTLNS